MDYDINDILEYGKKRIKWVLECHGIEVNDIIAYYGPRVSFYELDIDPRKISRIARLEKEITSSLSHIGSRIINPIPGKLAIGIELPNSNGISHLTLRDIFDNVEFLNCNYNLPIVLGVNPIGQIVIKDLTELRHILICGGMQQGKSTLIRQMVSSILLKISPENVKFSFIDTSNIELQEFKSLGRYWMAQDANDVDETVIYNDLTGIKLLTDLLKEMESRYNLLKEARARNILEYNKLFNTQNLNPEKGHHFLPYIVVICDEIASIQTSNSKELENILSQLLPKAVVVGIHCIFTTKYTSTDILTPTIRANFIIRVSHHINNINESRLILGNNQATTLLPHGDTLIFENGIISRCQVAKCDVDDITPLIKEIGKYHINEYPYILPEENQYISLGSITDRDPLFEEAARFICSYETASTSTLQRKFSIGYNRAGKIMDQLESAGIVGPAQGGRPRNVLVNRFNG